MRNKLFPGSRKIVFQVFIPLKYAHSLIKGNVYQLRRLKLRTFSKNCFLNIFKRQLINSETTQQVYAPVNNNFSFVVNIYL